MKRILLLFVLLLAGCQPQTRYETFSGQRQGTTYTVKVKNPQPGIDQRIDAVFDEIDSTFSMFDPASLTSRINRGEEVELTPLFLECFDTAREVDRLTDGFYDPTVKPLVDAWGFGPGERAAEPDVATIMEYVGMDKIGIEGGRIVKSDPRVELDFSSIAKGLTVDRLAQLLEGEGAADYLVDVGGEIRARGVNESGHPWRIGIESPSTGLPQQYEAVVSLGSEDSALTSIATSGNYRNRFVDEGGEVRTHTIDPKTGYPAVGEILSVSISAASCMVADAWATGIMAGATLRNARQLLEYGPRESTGASATESFGIEYYIIYQAEDSTKSVHSPGFPLAGD